MVYVCVWDQDMKRGTQRTLFDLPGATPKRSRLSLQNSSRNQVQDDDGASASTSVDTSTDQERTSTSTGQSSVASHATDDPSETNSSMNEGTTTATSPNDIANTRDCEPVRPVLKQLPRRMISGKLRGFSSQW